MKECLTNPTAGYYTTRAKEKQTQTQKQTQKEKEKEGGEEKSTASSGPGSRVFGPRGDFVTSPDISQLMGDCVGVWLASAWLRLREASFAEKVRIVELGPGRGTLLSDALRALAPLSKSGVFARRVEVELVEVSAALRRAQWGSLRCRKVGSSSSSSSSSPSSSSSSPPEEEPREAISSLFETDGEGEGIRVTWRSRLEDVPLSPSSGDEGDDHGKGPLP